MKEISYQNIVSILQDVMPDNWNKVVFYAEYGAGSYNMKYFVDLGSGKYIDCFELDGITRDQIIKSFIAIDKEISSVRKALSEKDKWYVMTLTVTNEGKFKADFEYEDISERSVEYFREWKKKYLK